MNQDVAFRKQYGAALKALSIAEIGVNLLVELSQINKQGAVNADLSQGYKNHLNNAAITRAAGGIAGVAVKEFADGGYTEVNGYRAQNIGTHSDGGFRSRPTLGLIGEKGPEYVATNLQLRQYPELFQELERNRIYSTPVQFAAGGFTQPYVAPATIGISAADIAAAVTSAVSGVTIVTQVRDINTAQETLATIVDGANI